MNIWSFSIQAKRFSIFKKSFKAILLVPFIVTFSYASNADEWIYAKAIDPSTNLSFSIVKSPLPRLDLYDDIRLGLECKDNKLKVLVDSDILITSQGSNFDFEYQIDQSPAVKIQMRTFPDSKRKGYTEEHAKAFAEAMQSGQAIFFRINTMIRRVLTGSIPLQGAQQPIKQIFNDCSLSQGQIVDEKPYTFAELEQDLNQLSPEQRKLILIKIKTLIDSSR